MRKKVQGTHQKLSSPTNPLRTKVERCVPLCYTTWLPFCFSAFLEGARYANGTRARGANVASRQPRDYRSADSKAKPNQLN